MALNDYSFNWDASTDTGGSGLKFYRVYKDGVQQGTTTALYYPAGYGAYPTGCWSVKAEDNAGNLSGALACISFADTTPPSQVTGLTATGYITTIIDLEWNAATDNVGVTGYTWSWSYDGYTWNLGGNTTQLYYSFSAPDTNTLYYFRVQAYDAANNQGSWSTTASAWSGDVI